MYRIFTYIWLNLMFTVTIGKYTGPMDPMGMNISYTGELWSKQGFSTRTIGVKSFDSWDAHNEVILREPSSHCLWGKTSPLTVLAICPLFGGFVNITIRGLT